MKWGDGKRNDIKPSMNHKRRTSKNFFPQWMKKNKIKVAIILHFFRLLPLIKRTSSCSHLTFLILAFLCCHDSNFFMQQVGSDQLRKMSSKLLIMPKAEIFCCHIQFHIKEMLTTSRDKILFQMSFCLSIYQVFSQFVCKTTLINKLFICFFTQSFFFVSFLAFFTLFFRVICLFLPAECDE